MNTMQPTTILPPQSSEFFMEHKKIPLHMKLDIPTTFEGEINNNLTTTFPLTILVHGFTGNMEETHLLAVRDEILRHNCACLRVELFGHGLSGGEFCNHDIMKWLEEIVFVIDYVSTLPWVKKLILAGHSQGGLLTVLAGGERADKLSALIPLSPGFSIPDEGRTGICFGQNFDPNNIPDRIPLFDGFYLTANYFEVSQKIYPDEYVKIYPGPVRIIHGDQDEVIPIEVSRSAAKLYKDCKLFEIAQDDHCFTRHMDQLVAAMDLCLQELL